MNTRDLRTAMNDLARDVPERDYAAEAWCRGRRRRTMRRWTITVAAAAAVVAIGASSWLTGLLAFATDDQYLDGTGEKPFATYHGRFESLYLVLHTGPLTFEDGCIRFGEMPLLLPDDTRWDPVRRELSLDGHTLQVDGQVVNGGTGDPVDANQAEHIPDSCRDDDFNKTKQLFQLGSLDNMDKTD